MKGLKRSLWLLLLLIFSVLFFFTFNNFRTAPITIVKEVPVERTVEVPKEVMVVKEVEVPVIQTIYQDRIIEKTVYPQWRKFSSIEDFPRPTIIPLAENQCLFFAQTFQQSLLEEGYIVSVAVSFRGMYNGTKVNDIQESHAGLLVETEEGFYFVDLLPWRVTRLF